MFTRATNLELFPGFPGFSRNSGIHRDPTRGDFPARGDLPYRVSERRGSREATSLSSMSTSVRWQRSDTEGSTLVMLFVQ